MEDLTPKYKLIPSSEIPGGVADPNSLEMNNDSGELIGGVKLGIAAGNTNEIQYNEGGKILGATSNFTYVKSTGLLSVKDLVDIGYGNNLDTNNSSDSLVVGDTNTVTLYSSTVIGSGITIPDMEAGLAVGDAITVLGNIYSAIIFGNNVSIGTGTTAWSLIGGVFVKTQTGGLDNVFAFGRGITTGSELTIGTTNTFNVGFYSTTPTFVIGEGYLTCDFGVQRTNNTQGGDILFQAQDGLGTGNGGNINIYCGSSGVNGGTGGSIEILSGSGTNGASSGDITITAADTDSTGYRGGNITLKAGDIFSATQTNGYISITAGSSQGTTETGGDIFLNAGNSSSTGIGGRVEINGGDSSVTGVGGDIVLKPGGGGAAVGVIKFYNDSGNSAVFDLSLLTTSDQTYAFPDTGGTFAVLGQVNPANDFILTGNIELECDNVPTDRNFTIQSQVTNNTAGNNFNIFGSAGLGTGVGGNLSFTAGDGGDTANGGTIYLVGGNGGLTSGNGGDISITAGSPLTSGSGGGVVIYSGSGVDDNSAGDITIQTGIGTGLGYGGTIYITAGNGGNDASGGDVSITAGSAGGGDNSGASITLLPGAKSGTGDNGYVAIVDPSTYVYTVFDTSQLSGIGKNYTFPNHSGFFALQEYFVVNLGEVITNNDEVVFIN